MNLYIAENIRRLRRERDITQEKLAERVGVTTQAVSKWERGDAYPDITLVLPLASYFGVSTDELLGLDTAKNEQKIMEYLAENTRLANRGRNDEQFELLRRAHGEFPNDWRIMAEYIWCLNYDGSFDTLIPSGRHSAELTRLSNRILDECTLDEPSYAAMLELATHYAHAGDMEKATAYANRFPAQPYCTRAQITEWLYDTGSDDWFAHHRANLRRDAENLAFGIVTAANLGTEPPREKIRLIQGALDLLSAIFDDGDYGAMYDSVFANFNFIIAYYHVELGEFDAALTHIERGFACAKAYDELPEIARHTSYLVRGVETDMRKIWHQYTGNAVSLRLSEQETRYGGKPFGETDAYRAVIGRYEPFAQPNK
ncbi:MAG: helix-turn-helix domain-containing protein [Oscillospiraceae bacterium]|jgi:transcriptional regulator with XRE-family HTH domain|nr:helix-turn-helix domain-containing protein [Oscillospiraceae bacterium]